MKQVDVYIESELGVGKVKRGQSVCYWLAHVLAEMFNQQNPFVHGIDSCLLKNGDTTVVLMVNPTKSSGYDSDRGKYYGETIFTDDTTNSYQFDKIYIGYVDSGVFKPYFYASFSEPRTKSASNILNVRHRFYI